MLIGLLMKKNEHSPNLSLNLFSSHYHLDLQANAKKSVQKNQFLASMRETGLYHDIFFKFSLRPFEHAEVKWRSMLNFDQIFLKIFSWVWKFGS